MKAAQAVSRLATAEDAAAAAAADCLSNLGGVPPIAALAFYGADYDAGGIARGLARVLGELPIAGCSTDGEISSSGLSVDSVCVMVLASHRARATVGFHERLSAGSEDAGRAIATELARPDRRVLVLLPDGLTGNGSAIIRGAQAVLGEGFVIAGGTAGDRGRFLRTTQIASGRVLNDALVGLMLHSHEPLEVGFGVMSGWKPMGIAKTVTDAEGNVVRRIEDQTALEVYATFLGDKASQLPAIGVEYPFALVDESGKVGERGMTIGEEYILLRAPMAVDRATGSISFAAEIPKGAKIKMTRAKSDAVVDAAREAAERAIAHLSGPPDVALFFSCMARKVVLGRRTNDEIVAAQNVLGSSTPLLGFYTYGEIANCGQSAATCRFHNETATFLVLREP